MTQLGLDFVPRPRTPIARTSDPVTSHLAAVEVTLSGQRDEQAAMALRLVTLRPGLTSAELGEHFSVDRYVLARRLPELRAEGYVRNGETARTCKRTGKRAMTWWPVEGGDR